jgi:hypothetical protein
MWYRIFASRSTMPTPEAISEFLAGLHKFASGEFAADETGWYRAEFRLEDASLQLERYLADEQGVRAELNSWAAWLETREDAGELTALMERMIQTPQLFTLQSSKSSALVEQACLALCRFLAENTAGVYQIDGRGLFTADGRLLVAE